MEFSANFTDSSCVGFLQLWVSSCVRLSEGDTETQEQVNDQRRGLVLRQPCDKALCERTRVYVTRGAVAVLVCVFGEGRDAPSHVTARCLD